MFVDRGGLRGPELRVLPSALLVLLSTPGAGALPSDIAQAVLDFLDKECPDKGFDAEKTAKSSASYREFILGGGQGQ